MADIPQSEFVTESHLGATIVTAYAKRAVKAYPIFENELDTVSFVNGLTLAFFSVGSALFSFAIGIWTNASFVEKLTPEGIVLSKYGGPVLLLLALVFFGLGIWAMVVRSNQWAKIKRESSSSLEAP